MQTSCIENGEAQKSPLFWRSSGGIPPKKSLKLNKSPIFTNPLVNPLVHAMRLVCTLLIFHFLRICRFEGILYSPTLPMLAQETGAGEEFLKSAARTAGNSAGQKRSAGRSAGSSAVASATKRSAALLPALPFVVPALFPALLAALFSGIALQHPSSPRHCSRQSSQHFSGVSLQHPSSPRHCSRQSSRHFFPEFLSSIPFLGS